MASNLFSSVAHLLVILFLVSSFSLSLAQDPASTPVALDNACNSTLYPYVCKSMLPSNHSNNIKDYGRFSVRRSLSTAKKFLNLIDRYLKNRSTLSTTAIQTLEDCRFLAGLNMDFLSTTLQTLNSTKPLLSLETDDVQTLLSAIMTNQQTCLDGLQVTKSAWSVRNGIYTPLSDGNKLYSVSLALFTRGWVHKKSKVVKPRKLMFSDMEAVRDGRLPLQMSRRNLEFYESVSRRKLLQTTVADVLVSDMVVVSQDGSGNFTTINDAVAAAPNNTNASDGYFLIYIAAGIYEEYVSIAKNKKNLMMIGDGINQTVITGNRSVVDGWTTFNSATLAVVGQGFVAINITVRNTAGAIKHQAVAVRNGADLSTFYSCSFEDLVSSNGTTSSYLGRPWKEYSRTVYLQSFIDSFIDPAGWIAWSGDFALSTLYYAEYNNTGAGSVTTNRVSWQGYHAINATDAANFTVSNFVLGDDWLPATGVPYSGGLL
ncbi:PREDICTED: probable pectinesterase/pectinesterase inhibitor 7 [Nelumbo nucifera]|uniref:pectinesterase n=1 Tax=Nelumbo nucifera TaxID=4432 RepID=A0A1U8A1V6_NELNU|nr:PREDICTED: probable pectinesterase/pectinesterase inhibitor 7 [Nelumbo nucifera]